MRVHSCFIGDSSPSENGNAGDENFDGGTTMDKVEKHFELDASTAVEWDRKALLLRCAPSERHQKVSSSSNQSKTARGETENHTTQSSSDEASCIPSVDSTSRSQIFVFGRLASSSAHPQYFPVMPLSPSNTAPILKQLPSVGLSGDALKSSSSSIEDDKQLSIYLVEVQRNTQGATGGGGAAKVVVRVLSIKGQMISSTISAVSTLASFERQVCASINIGSGSFQCSTYVTFAGEGVSDAVTTELHRGVPILSAIPNIDRVTAHCHARCPAGHSMEFRTEKPTEYGGNAVCDGCRTSIEYTSGFIHCSSCRSDACTSCCVNVS